MRSENIVFISRKGEKRKSWHEEEEEEEEEEEDGVKAALYISINQSISK